MNRVALFLLVAVSSVAFSEHFERARENRRTRPFSGGFAFFEFAPANGAGMGGGPCVAVATPITGATGQTLTFTRASTGTCTKTATGGLATTGIADGDLATAPLNTPRVEYDSAGVLGLLVESAGTNTALRSEEFENAAWSLDGTLTVTANSTVAPDGATTADTLDDNAATFEGLYQTITAVAGAYTCSVYLKGGTALTPSIQVQDQGGGGGLITVTPTLVTTSWTRVILSITTTAATTGYRFFIYPGASAGQQGTIFSWGADCKPGAYATSYIPTTSAAVTRAREDPSFAGVTWPTSASISWAGSVISPSFQSGTAATTLEFTSLASLFNESGGLIRWYTGTGLTTTIASAASGLRWYGWHNGATRGMAWGANTNTGADVAAANKFGATLFIGGSAGGGARPDGIQTRICVDPDPARCR